MWELLRHLQASGLPAADGTVTSEGLAPADAERLLLILISRAVEQTADSVFITNVAGVILYVNPAFEKLTGYSAIEAVGARPSIFKSGVQNEAYYARLWSTILSGKVHRFVVTNQRKNGDLYDEDQTISPIKDADGHITHFVCTGRDITKRKRAEGAVRRLNQQLELESARIAGVLHDVAGQFLTSAHLALATIARDVPPDLRLRLREVRQHLDDLEHHLRQLSHEQHPSILEDLGLVEAIRFTTDSFSRRSGIKLFFTGDPAAACSPEVAAIVYRFVQEALTNMSRHSGASRGEVDLGQVDGVIRCAVRDNGCGFDVAAAFSKHAGRGLGLTLIEDRLEGVGGTLHIMSMPGQGTELVTVVPAGA